MHVVVGDGAEGLVQAHQRNSAGRTRSAAIARKKKNGDHDHGEKDKYFRPLSSLITAFRSDLSLLQCRNRFLGDRF